jgi:hypothetical protein
MGQLEGTPVRARSDSVYDAALTQSDLQVRIGEADALRMKSRPVTQRIGFAATAGFVLTLALSTAALATTPLAGKSGNYRGQCRMLTKQINHYDGTILPMAIQRGNRDWERATNQQVQRLWHRRADLCPEYGAERTFLAKAADEVRKFNELVALASRAAVTFFTGGITGGL